MVSLLAELKEHLKVPQMVVVKVDDLAASLAV